MIVNTSTKHVEIDKLQQLQYILIPFTINSDCDEFKHIRMQVRLIILCLGAIAVDILVAKQRDGGQPNILNFAINMLAILP